MREKKERKLRCALCALLSAALLFSGIGYWPQEAYGAAVTTTVTKYHLDIGAQHIWGSGSSPETAVWEKGYKKGGPIDVSVNLEFPEHAKNVRTYAFGEIDFKWGENNYSFNENGYLKGQSDFNREYAGHVSSSIYNIRCASSGNHIRLSYTALLDSTQDFDLKQELNRGRLDFVLEVLGGEETVRVNYPQIYQRLVEGSENQLADNVYGYLYFTPVIIAYDVEEEMEIGELEALLDLPETAVQGNPYEAADASLLSEHLAVREALLEKHTGDGKWKETARWQGSDPGKNTGGRITETAEEPGTLTYRLTVTASDGQTDTDVKSIRITDGIDTDVQAKLQLPAYTYEGHPVEAEDDSTFYVNGEFYSPTRMYSENLASNKFSIVEPGVGSASRLTKTSAEMTFRKKGYYSGKLTVNTKDGKSSADVKPIEVRKTPSVEEILSGFQKQNRRQVLNIAVATYPDKPLVDYYVIVKDLKSGETARLTPESPQAAGAVIKTRALRQVSADGYWTNFALEFLTKKPDYTEGNREFQYTIWVKDSKGDTDSVTETFTVVPDQPPVAAINLQETFLRNAGTNRAEIVTEDASVADDQLQRTWSASYSSTAAVHTGNYVPAKSLPGYQDLAFGSGQKIQFEKEGVGKASVRLHVKDVWNEPTLPEYITDADYLTDETAAITEVTNIAPVVSLAPINTIAANIAILTEQPSAAAISAKINTLRAACIENGIDPNIQIVKAPAANDRAYSEMNTYDWHTAYGCDLCSPVDYSSQTEAIASDSMFGYVIESSQKEKKDYTEICVGAHTVRAIGRGGEAWNYTVTESNRYTISIDSAEKYVYLRCKDIGKTLVLHHDSGAYITALPLLLPAERPYLSSDESRLYFYDGKSFTKYDFKSGRLSKVSDRAGYIDRLQDGKITFVGKKSALQFYIGQFDMETELVTEQPLPALSVVESATAPEPCDMDTEGNVAFLQKYRPPSGGRYHTSYYWMASSRSNSSTGGKIASSGSGGVYQPGFVTDETGKAKYFYTFYQNSRDYHYLYIFELDERGLPGTMHKVVSESPEKNRDFSIEDPSYARYHSDEGKIYFTQGATCSYYLNGSGGRWDKGLKAIIDPANWETVTGPSGWDWDSDQFLGNGRTEDATLARSWNLEYFLGSSGRLSLFALGVTRDDAGVLALKKKARLDNEGLNFVVDLRGGAGSGDLPLTSLYLAQKDASLLSGSLDDFQTAVIDEIKEKAKESRQTVRLNGTAAAPAGLMKEMAFEKGQEYRYSYEMLVLNGSAVNLLKPILETTDRGAQHCRFAAEANFLSGEVDGFFTTDRKGWLDAEFDLQGFGAGYYDRRNPSEFYAQIHFTMEKPGFVDFDMFLRAQNAYYAYLTIDGEEERCYIDTRIKDSKTMRRFFEAGEHTIKLSGSGENSSYCWVGFTGIRAFYFTDEAVVEHSSLPAGAAGSPITVTGSLLPALPAYTKAELGGGTLLSETFAGGAVSEMREYLTISGGTINEASRSVSEPRTGSNHQKRITATYTAPDDKDLLVTFKEDAPTIYRSSTNRYPSNEGTYIKLGETTYLIPKGKTLKRDITSDRYNSATLSDIRFALLNAREEHGINTAGEERNALFEEGKAFPLPADSAAWYGIRLNDAKTAYSFTKYQPQQLTKTGVKLTTPSWAALEALVSNFTMWRAADGEKQPLIAASMASLEALQESGWQPFGAVEAYLSPAPPKEEDAPLIYKKGQLVQYGIEYADYENDPSRAQYWRYTHTPFNDGPHPQAAIVLDADGNVTAGAGGILSAPIDRFYVDGKYMLEHWQEDDTSRGLGGNPDYDRLSNVETLTFYVEGGASAPWITHIATMPQIVREGDKFQIRIGVDDAEKDVLDLTTEVYLEKKLIYTHRQKGIEADAKGVYPQTITDILPNAAVAGAYEVVCTVRDQTGAGIGSYQFLVVSEGKIKGFVDHTEKWEERRKEYKRPQNVFWPGEKFILNADVGGAPVTVKVRIIGTEYETNLKKAGKTEPDATRYSGTLWSASMSSRWPGDPPDELTFRFSADYGGGRIKTDDVKIIIDNTEGKVLLHRVW